MPEASEVWKSPITATGITCDMLALLSALISGRAVPVTAILSLLPLAILVFSFAFHLSEKVDSEGFRALLGTVGAFWAAVAALMLLTACLRFLGDFRLVR